MKKYLIPFIILLALIFTISVNAEDTKPSVIEPDIVLSADSVPSEYVYDVYYDDITEQSILHISINTFGTCIYDDNETPYIDGIRVNGETVNSYKIPIDTSVANKVVIRTTYKDDFTGTLAQISDGTYDYAELLKNPIALFTVIYYALAILSVTIGMFAALKGKSKKVKTANEIASSVDTRADAAFEKFINRLEPVFKHISETQESIVESIVLMNSKDPNAHLEAIECLKRISSEDSMKIIDKVKSELNESINFTKTYKQHTIEALKQIAEPAQEDKSNETDTDLPIF